MDTDEWTRVAARKAAHPNVTASDSALALVDSEARYLEWTPAFGLFLDQQGLEAPASGKRIDAHLISSLAACAKRPADTFVAVRHSGAVKRVQLDETRFVLVANLPKPPRQEQGDRQSACLSALRHRFQQSLQSLALFAAVLDDQSTEVSEKVTAQLRDTNRDLNNLLDRMATLHRLRAGAEAPLHRAISVQALFDDLQERYHDSGRSLRVVPTWNWTMSDPTMLADCLGLLIENALAYGRGEGVLLSCRRRDPWLSIQVVDCGPGIPMERMPDIFEDFMRLPDAAKARPQGQGLGLPMAAAICGALDHRLTLRSRPGRGSRFAIEVLAAKRPRS